MRSDGGAVFYYSHVMPSGGMCKTIKMNRYLRRHLQCRIAHAQLLDSVPFISRSGSSSSLLTILHSAYSSPAPPTPPASSLDPVPVPSPSSPHSSSITKSTTTGASSTNSLCCMEVSPPTSNCLSLLLKDCCSLRLPTKFFPLRGDLRKVAWHICLCCSLLYRVHTSNQASTDFVASLVPAVMPFLGVCIVHRYVLPFNL